MDQQFSLRWNNYLNQITDAFGSLRNEEDLVDVTLSCEGKKLKAHKMLLSACSTYFREIFKENPCQHPVIVFRNVKYSDIEAIVDFMYRGEVNVAQDQLESFLGTAELLEVKGLTDGPGKETYFDEEETGITKSMIQQETVSEVARPKDVRRSQPKVPFIPVTTMPASPPVKKRKYDTPSNQTKPPERKERLSVNELTSLPVVPKIEKQEYIEDLTLDEDDQDRLLSNSTSTENIQTHLINSKPDSCEEFNAKSNQSQDQQDRTLLPIDDHMLLPEPGTSVEGSQESMQVESTGEPVDEKEDIEINEVLDKQLETDKSYTSANNVKSDMSKSDKNNSTSGESVEATQIYDGDEVEIETSRGPVPEIAQLDKQEFPPKMSGKNPIMESKKEVKLPKGLTVTVYPVSKTNTQDQLEYQNEKTGVSSGDDQLPEDYVILRSEEAKTPVHDESYGFQSYANQEYEESNLNMPSSQIKENEPEMAEEAPELVKEQTPKEPPQEEKEPEFDYYGCQTCKADAKPVDRFNFTHRCPICPCVCFCSHLLKEHMKVIHGWFNVQRRFNMY